jgi:hypothetical protein
MARPLREPDVAALSVSYLDMDRSSQRAIGLKGEMHGSILFGLDPAGSGAATGRRIRHAVIASIIFI